MAAAACRGRRVPSLGPKPTEATRKRRRRGSESGGGEGEKPSTVSTWPLSSQYATLAALEAADATPAEASATEDIVGTKGGVAGVGGGGVSRWCSEEAVCIKRERKRETE